MNIYFFEFFSIGKCLFWVTLCAYVVALPAFKIRKSWPLLFFHQKPKKGHKGIFYPWPKPNQHAKQHVKIPSFWPWPRTFWPLEKICMFEIRPFLYTSSTINGPEVLKTYAAKVVPRSFSQTIFPDGGEDRSQRQRGKKQKRAKQLSLLVWTQVVFLCLRQR